MPEQGSLETPELLHLPTEIRLLDPTFIKGDQGQEADEELFRSMLFYPIKSLWNRSSSLARSKINDLCGTYEGGLERLICQPDCLISRSYVLVGL